MVKEKLLKYENMKLKNQLIFTLPAGKAVCNRECPGCYAIKSQIRFPKALLYRQRMLERSKGTEFVQDITTEIQLHKKPIVAIRLHESGEFYSQEYIDKWVTIAEYLPQHKFYAFTKRKKDFNFAKLESLPNFILIDSTQHAGLNYGTLDKMHELAQRTGAKICPATIKDSKNTCGISCNHCWTKVAQEKGVLFCQH